MNTKASLEAEMAALFESRQPFLVVDTETTGLPRDPDAQIIEISMIDQDEKTIFHSLLRPDIAVPVAATKIHGLTDADLAGEPTFAEIWPTVMEVLSHYAIIYCYNASFDFGMLQKTAQHYQLVPLPHGERQRWHCIMEKYAEYHGEPGYYGDYKWQSLGAACATLGVQMSEVHRATGDCLNTLAVMKALAAREILRRQRIS